MNHPFPWTGPPGNVALPHWPVTSTPLYGSSQDLGSLTSLTEDIELVRVSLGAPARMNVTIQISPNAAAGIFIIHWGAGNGSDVWELTATTTAPVTSELASQWIRVLFRPVLIMAPLRVTATCAIQT